MSKYLTTGDVARIYGVDKKTVWIWVQTGKLVPSHKTLGGHLRFRSQDVMHVMATGTTGRLTVICNHCGNGQHGECEARSLVFPGTGCACQHRDDPDKLKEPVSLLIASPDSGEENNGDGRTDH